MNAGRAGAPAEDTFAPCAGPAGAAPDPDAVRCRTCGAALDADEIALTRKLVDRAAVRYQCLDCLAAFFGCSTDRLRQKIEQFRRSGCTLFVSGK